MRGAGPRRCCIPMSMSTTLGQIADTTRTMTAHIPMTNEELVAEIQRLDGSESPGDRSLLAELQAKLFSQNAGLAIKIAHRYCRGRSFSDDEASEITMAVLVAARKYDPTRGVKFTSCLPWYVRSALQHEHAFQAGPSQSVYARARATVNNMDRYGSSEIAAAEALLRVAAPLDTPATAAALTNGLSAEDTMLGLLERASEEQTGERLAGLVAEACRRLTGEQRRILAALLAPGEARDESGLRTTRAVARQLGLASRRVAEQREAVVAKIAEHVFANEPGLCPPGWAPEQRGVTLPGLEAVVLGLFGTPTVAEMINYRRRR